MSPNRIQVIVDIYIYRTLPVYKHLSKHFTHSLPFTFTATLRGRSAVNPFFTAEGSEAQRGAVTCLSSYSGQGWTWAVVPRAHSPSLSIVLPPVGECLSAKPHSLSYNYFICVFVNWQKAQVLADQSHYSLGCTGILICWFQPIAMIFLFPLWSFYR